MLPVNGFKLTFMHVHCRATWGKKRCFKRRVDYSNLIEEKREARKNW